MAKKLSLLPRTSVNRRPAEKITRSVNLPRERHPQDPPVAPVHHAPPTPPLRPLPHLFQSRSGVPSPMRRQRWPTPSPSIRVASTMAAAATHPCPSPLHLRRLERRPAAYPHRAQIDRPPRIDAALRQTRGTAAPGPALRPVVPEPPLRRRSASRPLPPAPP
ncbi:hypothetical protein GQ55_5G412600 [Panicum hallii var. hallii]|uniref:Uncharacterized protein n=1 Tax=Panicum hallii var. hallii TaxID=1504633 RepID=A0A2T7DNR1_9POAL|nr:hypothetical protein GQ55_5G412600 [Panicum hallii var. hallii]